MPRSTYKELKVSLIELIYIYCSVNMTTAIIELPIREIVSFPTFFHVLKNKGVHNKIFTCMRPAVNLQHSCELLATEIHYMRFEVLMAVKVSSLMFWVVFYCGLSALRECTSTVHYHGYGEVVGKFDSPYRLTVWDLKFS
jgi:hypothetical protein